MKRNLFVLLAVIALVVCGCAEEKTHCVNSLTYTDIPDNDVLRVGKDYYMISTTMYFCPGAPIMHSRDLVHWQIISYVYDCLEDDDVYNLREGRNAYGKGQWAASLKYHNGEYYALFIANDQAKTYIYHTKDITSSFWDRYVIDRPFHDAGLLFEDDRVFIAWGNRNIYLTELEPDFSGAKGEDRLIFCTPDGYMLGDEGSHFYHIGDWYYVLTINWPMGGVRTETCWRSRNIDGPYESRTILQGAFDGRRDGVAQGAIIDTPKGDWYAIMFQDHGAVGRIPTLQPVTWEDGWPVLGDGGVPVKEFDVRLRPDGENRVCSSDDFDTAELDLVWQWNHKPLEGGWSLTERPGYMRIYANPANGIFDARNVLTQRTKGPECATEVHLETTGLKPGSHAGICAFQSKFCAIEVESSADGNNIVVRDRDREIFRDVMDGDDVLFRIDYDFNEDKAFFSYSYDGEIWLGPDYSLEMRYTLDFFTGYRTALYSYIDNSAENVPGCDVAGYADFDYLHF
ncbi:MAG: glycoside hydrolase 43 family protein [Bacteroidales bacterium]|nr:glycoside hydrolase 43 family protein [Bacteroidales bacterium]